MKAVCQQPTAQCSDAGFGKDIRSQEIFSGRKIPKHTIRGIVGTGTSSLRCHTLVKKQHSSRFTGNQDTMVNF